MPAPSPFTIQPTDDASTFEVLAPSGAVVATIYSNRQIRGILVAQSVADALTRTTTR